MEVPVLTVRNIPLQKRNEELCKIIQEQGDSEEAQSARTELIRINSDLVRRISFETSSLYEGCASFSYEDAIQEGNIGLLQAAAKYNPSIAAFSTYASFWVRQGIVRASTSMNNGGTGGLRVPESILRKYRAYRNQHRDMTDSEFFNAIKYDKGISPRVRNSFLDIYFAQQIVYLDEPAGENGEEDTKYVDYLTSGDDPEARVMEEAKNETLYEVLAELTEQEQWVLRNRYGIDRELTLVECGKIFPWGEVSRERIRQIEASAKRKIAIKTKKAKYSFLREEAE